MKKAEKLENEREKLKKEIEYEEKRLDVCAYGKSDLHYLESLKSFSLFSFLPSKFFPSQILNYL